MLLNVLYCGLCVGIKEMNVIENKCKYREERGVFYWVDFKLLIYIIKWVEENNSVIVLSMMFGMGVKYFIYGNYL